MNFISAEASTFAPGEWTWASTTVVGVTATLAITVSDVYTVNLFIREDGLRIDRLLLTTDTTPTVPTGFGPPETDRQLGSGGLVTPLTRTIVYTYDKLYRLTEADYTSGENYQYSYDKAGNRLQQIIDGDTTTYQYDAANRLAQLNGQAVYQFDDNGNLLSSDTLTNTFDAANRLIETERADSTLEPIYNGVGDRVGQTTSVTTTYFALDAMGLPEVIYTTEGNLYLHLPGVMMAESGTGEIRYLLSDGLGSVRQATDESGEVVAYNEFDPYGNPVQDDANPYGFTGEWWESDVSLLHLRARWYLPETGTFLSVDAVESEPPYTYVENNPISFIDPSGFFKCDPLTGVCENGYGLCVVQGVWQGAYVNGKPCIVNPDNVQTGNAPSVPPPRPPLLPSQLPTSPISSGNLSGLSQQDDRDLTPWLFKELKAGVHNRNIRFIRLQMRIPTPNNIVTANIQWRQLVRDKARYDFKHKIREEFFGETILFRTESRELLWSEYSIPGNIFYGYIGTSAGLGILLHAGAGYAEAIDSAHKEIRNICNVAYFPPERIPTLGDDPADYRAVQFGIDLWHKYGESLNLDQFRQELEQNYYKFAPPPAVPGENGIPAYPWSNPRGGWPYMIGRFNGPDEHKHWPPRLENGFGFYEF